MKRHVVLSLISACCFAPAAFAGHWGYEGHEGPEHWSELDPQFSLCASGKTQSPIDIRSAVAAELKPIEVNYASAGRDIVNNGHTVQVNFAVGSTINLDGHEFALKQVHFHAPSENLIDGKSFPLEAHLVHADANGNLAVIGVMYEEGSANAELDKAWRQMPAHADEKSELQAIVSPDALLPTDRRYYRFSGSLTTPPCSEGVAWIVMKRPLAASRQQIEQFAHTMHHPNNRPVQPINARLLATIPN